MLFIALLCAAAFIASAESLQTSENGWHTWQVDESDASVEMCCFTWQRGEARRSGCDLDGRGLSFSDHGDCAAGPGRLQVYARIENGTPVAIHALSANCPVTSQLKIVDFGVVTATENLAWFRRVIENRRLEKQTREQALMALVMSESSAAYEYLDRLLSSR